MINTEQEQEQEQTFFLIDKELESTRKQTILSYLKQGKFFLSSQQSHITPT
jgi:hypothetical protein